MGSVERVTFTEADTYGKRARTRLLKTKHKKATPKKKQNSVPTHFYGLREEDRLLPTFRPLQHHRFLEGNLMTIVFFGIAVAVLECCIRTPF